VSPQVQDHAAGCTKNGSTTSRVRSLSIGGGEASVNSSDVEGEKEAGLLKVHLATGLTLLYLLKPSRSSAVVSLSARYHRGLVLKDTFIPPHPPHWDTAASSSVFLG
jgi:hypothetical protein